MTKTFMFVPSIVSIIMVYSLWHKILKIGNLIHSIIFHFFNIIASIFKLSEVDINLVDKYAMNMK